MSAAVSRQAGYSRYAKYKASGCEWIGEVPQEWGSKPLGSLVRLASGGTPSKANAEFWVGTIPWVSPKDFTSDWIDDAEDHISEEALRSSATRLIAPGAALMVVRSGILRRVIPVAVNRVPVALNQDLKALIPTAKGATIDFLRWFIRGFESVLLTLWRHQGATVESLDTSSIRKTVLPQPSSEEQAAICTFLGRKTVEIDALIVKKVGLRKLLAEKKQALAQQAVTKGLDPSAPQRASGVSWIGSTPAHWEVRRIKWAARLESGHTPDRKIEEYWQNCDIPWVSLADTGRLRETDLISETTHLISQLGLRHSSARILPAGAVVFSRDATVGLAAITARPMAVSQHFIAWICGPKLLPEYLLFVVQAMTQELERLTNGATITTIGMTDVKSLATPLPPIEEQRKIVDWIRAEAAKIDALDERILQAIERLREYRTALISAAVTGKIDVRSYQTTPCQ